MPGRRRCRADGTDAGDPCACACDHSAACELTPDPPDAPTGVEDPSRNGRCQERVIDLAVVLARHGQSVGQ